MDVNICIVGAGVVGLAVARELSFAQKGIFILEKNEKFGQEISSRNSEVIHSGLYYPTGSLKAQLCVRGNRMIYDYCKEKKIKHQTCGKLIVCQKTDSEQKLTALRKQATLNKVETMYLSKKESIEALEPHIQAHKAHWVPSTGIIDSHGLMQQLLFDGQENGVEVAYDSKVTDIVPLTGGYRIRIQSREDKPFTFTSKWLINCAGLGAGEIAKMAGIWDETYQLYFCKGEYFRVAPPKNRLISRLIYPLPDPRLEGLGIHATIELDGGVKLGPNALYLNEAVPDYKVDAGHRDLFYTAASKYLPFLEPGDLSPDMAGIRPKLQARGSPTRDFIIQHETTRGLPGLIDLIGIESPGLTASMAIAEYVHSLIKKQNYHA